MMYWKKKWSITMKQDNFKPLLILRYVVNILNKLIFCIDSVGINSNVNLYLNLCKNIIIYNPLMKLHILGYENG